MYSRKRKQTKVGRELVAKRKDQKRRATEEIKKVVAETKKLEIENHKLKTENQELTEIIEVLSQEKKALEKKLKKRR